MASQSTFSGRGGSEDDMAQLDDFVPVPDDNPDAAGAASQDVTDDEDALPAEEEEGEDLLENMENDYRPMSAMDRYEAAGLDQEYTEEMGYEEQVAARLAAEAQMERRDATGGRRRKRMPGALEGIDDDDFADVRRRRLAAAADEDDGDGGPARLALEEFSGCVSDWVANAPVAAEVQRRFRRFLRGFQDDKGQRVYMQRIEAMVLANRQSLEVAYGDLIAFPNCQILAVFVADAPRPVLELFNDAARDLVHTLYEQYSAIHNDVFVRFTRLPVDDKIRDLRTWHLGNLIKVTGVVTRRTGVFPQLKVVTFDCGRCGSLLGPFAQQGDTEVRPAVCSNCQSKGPFTVNAAETVYQNYQKLTLQESPGTVPAGRLPRQKEVILLHDLIDCARPGEEVEVTGIYCSGYDAQLNARTGFPVFSTHIEANWVSKQSDLFSIYKLTDEDKAQILRLAGDKDIGRRIIQSIAPSIYGHENIKTSLALALFGGVEKQPSHSHRLRGDINCLLLGDPGTAKSQFLKYVEKTAMRAVYTTGKGASAVGLTAAVHKDPITREWTLEGGALVLADKGVCLIDEFDKMNDQDRVSIHEAMEQQSISVSKAGIVTQLQARCSVIAAANPVGGRYDPSKTFSENVELTDPILSRFDCMCVVRDVVDPINDGRLAQFVVGSHARSHPSLVPLDPERAAEAAEAQELGADGTLPQVLLRKYITYAKQHCRPQLSQSDHDMLIRVYTDLRREASRTHGMPIAVRHLESMIRMSEAHARMHLRDAVTGDDVQVAIRVMVESFISTQKYSLQRELQRSMRRFIVLPSDYYAVLLHALRDLLRQERQQARMLGDMGDEVNIPCRLFEDKARELQISDLPGFYASDLFKGAFRLDRATGAIVYSG
ncbi:MAG: MCM2/3/5 family-domain-containing protein [Monoraphidium minutum]|nr:MAG: MCM2/3/5 family-domain-containing protein [Monoraphidium minutum]